MKPLHLASATFANAAVLLVVCAGPFAPGASAANMQSLQAPSRLQAFSARSGEFVALTEWWITGDDVLRAQLSTSPSGQRPAENLIGAFLRKPLGGPIAATAAIEARTTAMAGRSSSLRLAILPAIEWSHGSFAVYAGGGVAQIRNSDGWKQAQSASIGWRLQHQALRFELNGRFNRFERTETVLGAWYMDPDSVLRRDPIGTRSAASAYRDLQLSVGWDRGAFAAVAKLGGRSSGDPVGPRTFGGLDTAWQLTPRLALLAGYAFEPSVPEEGIPARQASRAGLRVTLGHGDRAASLMPRGRAEPAAFRVAPARSGRYTVSCRVLQARTVEISGDFCDWQPRPMTREGEGWWTAESALSPGSHRLSIRIDGGPWIAPPGLSSVSDEFGGSAGVFVVR